MKMNNQFIHLLLRKKASMIEIQPHVFWIYAFGFPSIFQRTFCPSFKDAQLQQHLYAFNLRGSIPPTTSTTGMNAPC